MEKGVNVSFAVVLGKMASLEKHSKLLSLRDTIFIDAQQQGSKLLEVSTESLSFRESRYYSNFCF